MPDKGCFIFSLMDDKIDLLRVHGHLTECALFWMIFLVPCN